MKRGDHAALVGQTFGRLTLLSFDRVGEKVFYECRCECGCVKIVSKQKLLAGKTRSCGCYQKEQTSARFTTHRASNSTEYICWRAMKQRCECPKFASYYRYGGRGIAVCERWKDFNAFLADMGRKPTPAHTLERKDNEGNYEPGNCVWSTRAQQSRNKCNNRFVTIGNETKTIAEWSEISGVVAGTIWSRLKLGWSGARLLEPARRRA